jgi:DNA-binding MarR family transcriptional regulator
MKISAEAATANQQLINELQAKWKEENTVKQDRTFFRYMSRTGELFPEISRTTRAVLDEIAMCAPYEASTLTVTEAMEMHHIASPATIHRCLESLSEHGYIASESRNGNRRTKFLVTTDKALKAYEQLAQAMKEAVNDVN